MVKKHALSYCAARVGAAADDLTVACRETVNFTAPLRLHGGGTHNEHPLDADFTRQQLREADPLDGLAEPHVVGQDGAAGAGREGNAVELIRQERHLEECFAQWVAARIAPDFCHRRRDALLHEAGLDVFLGVGIDRDRHTGRLGATDARKQVRHVGDRLVAKRVDDARCRRVEPIRKQQA
jgi:hypothetical protein